MTTRTFKNIFFTNLGLCILLIILSSTLYEFVEVSVAISWTIKYFAFPILILMIPICYIIYFKFLIQHEGKMYKSLFWINIRSFFRIFILTAAMTGIYVVTTLSLILLSNSLLGANKAVNLNSEIIDYYTTKNKGPRKYYIRIRDIQIDRIIELQVDKPYEIGQQFSNTMFIGKWGLLYSKK